MKTQFYMIIFGSLVTQVLSSPAPGYDTISQSDCDKKTSVEGYSVKNKYNTMTANYYKSTEIEPESYYESSSTECSKKYQVDYTEEASPTIYEQSTSTDCSSNPKIEYTEGNYVGGYKQSTSTDCSNATPSSKYETVVDDYYESTRTSCTKSYNTKYIQNTKYKTVVDDYSEDDDNTNES
ncbi:hypothetical protein BB561_001447 [Smittium simulii]|uniref:Uncharacterized protein n=1 Tax=Smittium simulii TaxID=133385 RepID=A0A2T9YUI6_9FUNG|nr:hypothetical protein BB561_001447 [Smittium simulii]